MIPFSAEVFFASLEDYNATIWPRQILFLTLGLACIWFTLNPTPRRGQMTGLILAAAWFHTGVTYHFGYFAELNFWDYLIGGVYLMQAVLLLIWLWRGKFSAPRYSPLSAALISSGLLLMPLIVFVFGRSITETGWFGTAPVPTLVVTAGALVYAAPRSLVLWLLPALASVAALVPAVSLPLYEDVFAGLVLAVFLWLLTSANKNRDDA
ncbi:MAG: DUF6064 family protein [Pseudomonadota bacterium]